MNEDDYQQARANPQAAADALRETIKRKEAEIAARANAAYRAEVAKTDPRRAACPHERIHVIYDPIPYEHRYICRALCGEYLDVDAHYAFDTFAQRELGRRFGANHQDRCLNAPREPEPEVTIGEMFAQVWQAVNTFREDQPERKDNGGAEAADDNDHH